MKKRYVVGLMASLLTLGAGCDDGTTIPTCTTELRTSVEVRVVEAMGAPLTGVRVTYHVDSGPLQEAEYVSLSDPCPHFLVGFEVAGDFTIRAERAGFQPATASIRVERDACHVHTQGLVLTLAPA